jgi:hypothetical protein
MTRAIKSVKHRASRKMPIEMPMNESVAVGRCADYGNPHLPPLPLTPTRQQAYRDVDFTPRTTNGTLPTSINITGRRCVADSSVLEDSWEEFEDNFEDSDYLGDEIHTLVESNPIKDVNVQMKQTFHGSSTEVEKAAIEPFQEWFIKMCGLPFCFDRHSSMYNACSCLNKLVPSYEDAVYYMVY